MKDSFRRCWCDFTDSNFLKKDPSVTREVFVKNVRSVAIRIESGE